MRSKAEAELIATNILNLFEKYGDGDYIGEAISQTQHMMQAGMLAERDGYGEEIILAAFLHDIGHLLGEKDSMPSMAGWGTLDHEGIAERYLQNAGFPAVTCQLVRNHVQAKRYLCWKDKSYHDRLSNASKETLKRQGGKMSDEEAKAFEDSGILRESIKIRMWDEAAKETEGIEYPTIEKYRSMMVNVLTTYVAKSPKKGGESPKKEKAASPKKIESPKRTESPKKAGESPQKAGESPKKAAESPKKAAESPKKVEPSPKKSTSPSKRAAEGANEEEPSAKKLKAV